MNLTIDALPDNPEILKQLIQKLSVSVEKKESQIQKKQSRIEILEEQLRALQRHRFGKRSEKNPDQLELQFLNEAELLAQESPVEPETESSVKAHTRRQKATRVLPAELPRVEVVHELSDAEKECSCGVELR